MKHLRESLDFIRTIEGIKSVTRTAWTGTGRQESTAEHSFRLALLALTMCLIHDLGELYTGDIPDFNYAFNLTYGASYFEGDPRLKELRDILDAETKARITHTQEKENHTP